MNPKESTPKRIFAYYKRCKFKTSKYCTHKDNLDYTIRKGKLKHKLCRKKFCPLNKDNEFKFGEQNNSQCPSKQQ